MKDNTFGGAGFFRTMNEKQKKEMKKMTKYINTMKDLELPENTIKVTKNIDDYNFDKWKKAAVSNLLAAYPEKFRDFPRYVDWSTAMKFLNEVYKRGNKE